MAPVMPIDACEVFYDGTITDPRLLHPEGIAVASDGSIWCGGELGQIYRLEPDGSVLEERASTGGFILGLAFDADDRLYACDMKHRAVFRYTPSTGELESFASGNATEQMRNPNWPVVDLRRNCLYVSDSYDQHETGPGIWRFDLDTGEGDLWYPGPLSFANGMALTPDGSALLIAETFAHRISRIPIESDGTAGERSAVIDTGEAYPDGLALDSAGNLYIACYEPSQLLRLDPDGTLEVYLHDPTAHILCHPTNCAFRDQQLFIANLGRWHISTIDTGTPGIQLPVSYQPGCS